MTDLGFEIIQTRNLECSLATCQEPCHLSEHAESNHVRASSKSLLFFHTLHLFSFLSCFLLLNRMLIWFWAYFSLKKWLFVFVFSLEHCFQYNMKGSFEFCYCTLTKTPNYLWLECNIIYLKATLPICISVPSIFF